MGQDAASPPPCCSPSIGPNKARTKDRRYWQRDFCWLHYPLMHMRPISSGAGASSMEHEIWPGLSYQVHILFQSHFQLHGCSQQNFFAIPEYLRPEQALISLLCCRSIHLRPEQALLFLVVLQIRCIHHIHFSFTLSFCTFPVLNAMCNSCCLDICRCLPYTWHLSAMLNLEWLSSDPCKRHVISSLMWYLLNTGGEKDNPFPSFLHLKDKSLYLYCLEN